MAALGFSWGASADYVPLSCMHSRFTSPFMPSNYVVFSPDALPFSGDLLSWACLRPAAAAKSINVRSMKASRLRTLCEYLMEMKVCKRRDMILLASLKSEEEGLPQHTRGGDKIGRKNWCGCHSCSRRSLLASLGGTLVSGVRDKETQAAYAVKDMDPTAMLEAVHPARPGWYEEFYAQVVDTSMRPYEAQHSGRGKMAGYKQQLFRHLDDSVTTVMEIGIGTGPNLSFYGRRPHIKKVIGVDPNEHMARFAGAAAASVGLTPSQFEFVHAVGEKLPVRDSSVDAVVSTLVLCSVSDISSTLKEMQRVLKPGGIFLFVEHVSAPEGSALRFWQNLLDPVQQLVADGCHLTRDTLSFIEAANFADMDIQRVIVQGASLIAPHILGTARNC